MEAADNSEKWVRPQVGYKSSRMGGKHQDVEGGRDQISSKVEWEGKMNFPTKL